MSQKCFLLMFTSLAMHSLPLVAADDSTDSTWTYNPNIALPPAMTVCKRTLPVKARNQCIKESINKLLPTLKNGYPELGIAPLDPFVVQNSVLEYTRGPIHAKFDLNNAVAIGLSDIEVKTVRSRLKDQSLYLELDMYFPELRMSTNFAGGGLLNFFNLFSQGHADILFSGVSETWKFEGILENIEGNNYMKIKSYETVRVYMENMKMNATGLLPFPDLDAFVVEFINQYWEPFSREMFPQTKVLFSPFVLNIVNKIFGRVPFDRLMPKN